MSSDLTPAHWKVYEVFRDGKAFNLRHHISKVVILPGDYKLMKIDRTAKMTKAQALEIGEAAERWESGNQTEEKKSRRRGMSMPGRSCCKPL
jgi:hypothetical protein